MTRSEQENSYNLLKRLGLIEQANFDIPCKKHFRLSPSLINDFFFKDLEFSKNVSSLPKNGNWIAEKRKLVCQKTETATYIHKEHKEEHKKESYCPTSSVSAIADDIFPFP